MKRLELARRGVTFIEGQRNMFNQNNSTHQRSYICVVMKVATFNQVKSMFSKYNVKYISQTNSEWDLRAIQGRVWVTTVHGKGTTSIELLDDYVLLEDDDVYVVMWNARFLPKFMRTGRCFDMDTLLIDMLDGHKKLQSWFARWIGSMLFSK